MPNSGRCRTHTGLGRKYSTNENCKPPSVFDLRNLQPAATFYSTSLRLDRLAFPIVNDVEMESESGFHHVFRFRPWVRRAGLSIVAVAGTVSALVLVSLSRWPESRFGWMGERFVWVYLGTLWIGGLKVWLGARGAVAELCAADVLLRPLHTFRSHRIPWGSVRGTEQMTGGDRLIVYHQTVRGLRFVALNLNLIRGRREFLVLLEERLRSMGFVEKTVERSRYLTAPDDAAR